MNIRFAAAALALLAAAPSLAQTPPPRAGMRLQPPEHGEGPMRFGTMSEAGRRTMMAAMESARDGDRADRDRVRAARDRILAILDAERLDSAALRRTMDEERAASTAMKMRRQTAMTTAFERLSVADRRAFVADARMTRGRVEGRMGKMSRFGGRDMGSRPPEMM